jgi:hypothetical protein
MPARDYFPVSAWIWRTLTGRNARRVYAMIVLALVVTTTAIRVHSYLLARRIQAVISDMSKLRIDETTEEKLVQTVPYLVRDKWDRHVDKNPELGNVDPGVERSYHIIFSNQEHWVKFERFAWRYSQVQTTEDGHQKSWIFTAADLLGYRYAAFGARVTLLNGRVTSIRYGIEDRLVFPQVFGSIVSVESAHARWGPHQTGFEVTSTDDESPQFRVGGSDASLGASFIPDASPELRSHAFQLNLKCFWSWGGCRHARQIAPLLWQDYSTIRAGTLARLKSSNPCPDSILAGRVSYLPDINVVLLQSTGFKLGTGYVEGGIPVDEIRTQYKLIGVLRGRTWKSWEPVGDNVAVPYPGDYTRQLPNTGLRWAKRGEKVLAFPDFSFDSCRVVPATPSALLAVRNAVPAPRRAEDMLIGGLQ